MDQRADSISLYRLLDEIRRYAEVVSRRSYVAMFPAYLRESAHRQFDAEAGVGKPYLSSSKVGSDLRALLRAHYRIRVIVNKRFAHLDQRNLRRRPPKMEDIEAVARLFERVLLRYQVLLTAKGQTGLLPVWQYDWTSVFREPWIDVSAAGRSDPAAPSVG
jgi:hypothetical protein